MSELLNTMVTRDKYEPEKPSGWLGGVPYYLLNPNLHKESLRIDYGLCFVKYDVKRDLDMYMLEPLIDDGQVCTRTAVQSKSEGYYV